MPCGQLSSWPGKKQSASLSPVNSGWSRFLFKEVSLRPPNFSTLRIAHLKFPNILHHSSAIWNRRCRTDSEWSRSGFGNCVNFAGRRWKPHDWQKPRPSWCWHQKSSMTSIPGHQQTGRSVHSVNFSKLVLMKSFPSTPDIPKGKRRNCFSLKLYAQFLRRRLCQSPKTSFVTWKTAPILQASKILMGTYGFSQTGLTLRSLSSSASVISTSWLTWEQWKSVYMNVGFLSADMTKKAINMNIYDVDTGKTHQVYANGSSSSSMKK